MPSAVGLVRLGGVAFVLGFATPALAADARAAEPVTLEWIAPDACPSRAQMIEQIARTVAHRAKEPIAARALLFEGATGGWRGEVELSGGGASSYRRVDGDSCRSVSDALALIIALAVNPDAEPATPTRTSPVAPAPAKELPPPPPQSSRRLFVVGASLAADGSLLPSASYGGEVALGWNPPHADLEATFVLLASTRATLAARPSEGADFWLVHAGVRACYEIFDAPLDVGPCAAGGVEWLVASGFGSQSPTNATGQIGVVTLGGRVIAHFSPWLALRLVAEEVVPLARPEFFIDNAGTVFRTPASSFRASGGAELHF